MTVKQLKEFLKNKDDSKECFFSVWSPSGEKRYRSSLPCNDYENDKFICITWQDDCRAGIITDQEYTN
jgi:hypothetical protein